MATYDPWAQPLADWSNPAKRNGATAAPPFAYAQPKGSYSALGGMGSGQSMWDWSSGSAGWNSGAVAPPAAVNTPAPAGGPLYGAGGGGAANLTGATVGIAGSAGYLVVTEYI